MLDPQPGDRVLDLCAAPGGKTIHLADLMGGEGEIVAVEVHEGRAAALRETCARMHASVVRVEQTDAAEYRTTELFDRVLVDPPCSGLGTLQSRPDLRWRTDPERIAGAAGLQERVLQAGATAVRSGGVLVYSVCTISRTESTAIVDRFLARNRDFIAEPVSERDPDIHYLQLMPHLHGTDGFFVARLRRR
jgi:16S rRNA (cytosine967-C5)-methyltransferase